jgi:hypothetical protein
MGEIYVWRERRVNTVDFGFQGAMSVGVQVAEPRLPSDRKPRSRQLAALF